MLRGVNRQIIELTSFDSKMFEKAILYVKPEFCEENEEILRKSAEKFISSQEYLNDISPIFKNSKKDKKSRKRLWKNK